MITFLCISVYIEDTRRCRIRMGNRIEPSELSFSNMISKYTSKARISSLSPRCFINFQTTLSLKNIQAPSRWKKILANSIRDLQLIFRFSQATQSCFSEQTGDTVRRQVKIQGGSPRRQEESFTIQAAGGSHSSEAKRQNTERNEIFISSCRKQWGGTFSPRKEHLLIRNKSRERNEGKIWIHQVKRIVNLWWISRTFSLGCCCR